MFFFIYLNNINMTSILSEIIPEHDGIITVIKPNKLNTRLAVGGSDGKINIFKLSSTNINEQPPLFATQLIRHFHGVLDLDWSPLHPHISLKTFLASVSYDRTLIIWEETSNNEETLLLYNESHSYYDHTAPITSCAFTIYKYDLILLCCSLDGSISLHQLIKDTHSKWSCKYRSKTSSAMYTGVSFSSVFPLGNTNDNGNDDVTMYTPLQFVTVTKSGEIVEWSSNEELFSFKMNTIDDGVGYIESVEWLKAPTREEEVIAVGLNEGKVKVYKKDSDDNSSQWKLTGVININDSDNDNEEGDNEGMVKKGNTNIKVSWSELGSVLIVCSNGYKVRYFEENLDNKWEEVYI